MEYVRIKQATKQGYIKCRVGGVFNGAYPTSKLRRARVINEGEVAPTIMANGNEIYRIEKNKNKRSRQYRR